MSKPYFEQVLALSFYILGSLCFIIGSVLSLIAAVRGK